MKQNQKKRKTEIVNVPHDFSCDYAWIGEQIRTTQIEIWLLNWSEIDWGFNRENFNISAHWLALAATDLNWIMICIDYSTLKILNTNKKKTI